MPSVDSSAISRIDYDEGSQRLYVTFRDSGETYTYYRVLKAIYDEFLRAPSQGIYFNDRIKNRYPCKAFADRS